MVWAEIEEYRHSKDKIKGGRSSIIDFDAINFKRE